MVRKRPGSRGTHHHDARAAISARLLETRR
uniref:Uncharacterized protein n=1 Tax=Myoviridae sp. ctRTx89 TaxID=2826652 RepID=A0A8S5QTB2_9CAUD|nr:MAG TPA: hypothetical protein [Myoviridae sp. ctRTx89]